METTDHKPLQSLQPLQPLQSLSFDTINHACWHTDLNQVTPDNPMKLSSVRYLRFRKDVLVDHVLIHPVYTRWAPDLYGQPEHIQIAVWRKQEAVWDIILDTHLPPYTDDTPHKLKLDGGTTNHLCVRCLKEHPVEPSHGEQWEAPHLVPFKILDKIQCMGTPTSENPIEPFYNPPMQIQSCNPLSKKNMNGFQDFNTVKFVSPSYKIGFSTRRPMIVHLGWDELENKLQEENLLFFKSIWLYVKMFSGPIIRTLEYDIDASLCGGVLEVENQTLRYKDITMMPGLHYSLEFKLELHGFKLTITRAADHDIPALECDDFRFVWDLQQCITGTLANPIPTAGRTGRVSFPLYLNAPGHGAMLVHAASKNTKDSKQKPVAQVDSWRDKKLGWVGFQSGIEHNPDGTVLIKKGEWTSQYTFKLTGIIPNYDINHFHLLSNEKRNSKPKPLRSPLAVMFNLRRNTTTGLTFRPELAGFSNNSASVNCHLSQYVLADFIPYLTEDSDEFIHTLNISKRSKKMDVSMIELYRYTIELALKNGPGYGSRRDLYLDSDPSLLIGLGRIEQVAPNQAWLDHLKPFIYATVERVMQNRDDSGLLVCRSLTGNAGSKKWSSNGWDVVSFGNYDAYSNILAYRGLMNAAGIAARFQDSEKQHEWLEAAASLKRNFYSCFYNPETNWLAGWRSKDDQLHDYGFTFINYMAICFGLVDSALAKQIVKAMDQKMKESNLECFRYGIPANLISIQNEDAPNGQDYLRKDGLDSYGIYVNGSLTLNWSHYFIRALELTGFHKIARRVCQDIMHSMTNNLVTGGLFSGTEFFTWEEQPCGYEGVLVGQFPVISAIAQHFHLVETLEPEWWL